MRVDKSLANLTTHRHIVKISNLFDAVGKQPNEIDTSILRAYLSQIKATLKPKSYNDILCSIKRFFRDYLKSDIAESFDFIPVSQKPIVLPNQQEMKAFFEALPACGLFQGEEISPTYKGLFLFLASSGLRIEEAISLRKQDFYLQDRMVIPAGHENRSTKNSWVSFYSPECDKYLLPLLAKKAPEDRVFPWTSPVREAFYKARKKTGIRITPQILREWFCCELGKLGIPDRYVDAFCGRIPKSILARRYTDYSPRVLKTVYEKANLRVCLENQSEVMVAAS